MGQKMNPHGLRVGIIKEWTSQWYEDNENLSSVNKSKNWNSTAKICYFDFSAVKQFIRIVMQKFIKRLRLPRQTLV